MRTNVALDTWALCRFSSQRAAHAHEQWGTCLAPHAAQGYMDVIYIVCNWWSANQNIEGARPKHFGAAISVAWFFFANIYANRSFLNCMQFWVPITVFVLRCFLVRLTKMCNWVDEISRCCVWFCSWRDRILCESNGDLEQTVGAVHGCRLCSKAA